VFKPEVQKMLGLMDVACYLGRFWVKVARSILKTNGNWATLHRPIVQKNQLLEEKNP
jgi:hypothetical protein